MIEAADRAGLAMVFRGPVTSVTDLSGNRLSGYVGRVLGKRPEWLHAGVVFGLLLFGLAYLQFDWMGAEFSAGILHGANEDWDWQLTMYEVTRLGVVDWGMMPVWNPFTQGGVPLLANPEFPLFYPPFALVLALGTEAGIKLGILFHYGLLILGCWVREMGLSRLSAHLGAAFLVFSAFLPGFVAYGHIMFLPLGWLPGMGGRSEGALGVVSGRTLARLPRRGALPPALWSALDWLRRLVSGGAWRWASNLVRSARLEWSRLGRFLVEVADPSWAGGSGASSSPSPSLSCTGC